MHRIIVDVDGPGRSNIPNAMIRQHCHGPSPASDPLITRNPAVTAPCCHTERRHFNSSLVYKHCGELSVPKYSPFRGS
ncbi:hypothetical protein BST61_g9903 [Cercospora zeina]